MGLARDSMIAYSCVGNVLYASRLRAVEFVLGSASRIKRQLFCLAFAINCPQKCREPGCMPDCRKRTLPGDQVYAIGHHGSGIGERRHNEWTSRNGHSLGHVSSPTTYPGWKVMTPALCLYAEPYCWRGETTQIQRLLNRYFCTDPISVGWPVQQERATDFAAFAASSPALHQPSLT
jgi:hypothetical protein